jgi:hypothetical protein
MRKVFFNLSLIFCAALSLQVTAGEFKPKQFAEDYFNAWSATQSPKADKKALEHYLSFLADNVGHQHYPYDNDDTRHADGKQKMREGMTYYLGAHKEYSAKLLDVTYDLNVVVIKYHSQVKAVHPQNGQLISDSYTTLEVLELESGKVSMIRKYSE